MKGPSRCKPSTPSRPAIEHAAAMAVRICSRVSLIRVGRQRRSAKAAVCPGNGAHALGGRLIVEQNAATAIDLQIDETRSHKSAGWKLRLRPIGGNFARGSKSDDATVPDQNRGFCMPAVTVKNSIRQDGMPVGD